MSLLNRVRNIVRANVNDAVSRSEDPEKTLNQMIADMSDDLVKVRQAVALAISAQNRLQAEYDQRIDAVNQWQKRAEMAVDQHDDNLARQALQRKVQYQNEADQLKQSLDAQSGHLDELRQNAADLENRVQQAVSQRNQLVARYRVAEASKTLEQRLGGSQGDITGTMGQLESKVTDAEAQAAAYHELSRDPLEDKFKQLEAGTAANSVDDQLAQLKKQRLLNQG